MPFSLKCKVSIKKIIKDNTFDGEVQIVSEKEIEINRGVIEISGYATCNWKLGKARMRHMKIYKKNTMMDGLDRFFYTRRTLCGGEIPHRHSNTESYSFTCFWPSRLPGTWYGDYGHIKYIGKVTIKLSTDLFVHNQEIFVNSKRDLSLEPHLGFECRMDVKRDFFTTKPRGHTYVSVWVPMCGIAAGQSLPILCTIHNNSALHFGSLIFVLTRIDIYSSDKPFQAVKKVRTDVCRVARMVNIHRGKYEYYSVLHTNKNILPTNQFYACTCCQIVYEAWVSVQAVFPRYRHLGYPNISTPGIPIIIGTAPLKEYDIGEITADVFSKMFEFQRTITVEELPEYEVVKQLMGEHEEELQSEVIANLQRQLVRSTAKTDAVRKKSSDLV